MNNLKTTIRDGIVRYWSVYRQVWVREHAAYIPDRELAAMDEDERRAIAEAAAQHAEGAA